MVEDGPDSWLIEDSSNRSIFLVILVPNCNATMYHSKHFIIQHSAFSVRRRAGAGGGEGAHVEVVRDVALEAVDDRARVVEVRADVGRADVRARAREVDAVPLNELVLAAVVPVVLPKDERRAARGRRRGDGRCRRAGS